MEIPVFNSPRLVDEDLCRQLAQRGMQERRRSTAITIAMTVATVLIYLLLVLESFHIIPLPSIVGVSYLSLVLVSLMSGLAFSAIETLKVKEAFGRRQYDLVSILCPRAIAFNSIWGTVASRWLADCLLIQWQLLMLEGRFSEFEALMRYAWGHKERRIAVSGVPTDQGIANNLAIALLGQNRYEEAESILQQSLASAKLDRKLKLVLLNNLALAQVKLKRVADAERTLQQALTAGGNKIEPRMSWRLDLVRGFIHLQKEEFEEAEYVFSMLLPTCKRLREPPEEKATIDAALGEIRFHQGRLEESELYTRNAVEALQSAPNPNYMSLIGYLCELAKCLHAQGKTDEARQHVEHANALYSAYVERETSAIEAIKSRLQDPRMIWSSPGLLQKKELPIRLANHTSR